MKSLGGFFDKFNSKITTQIHNLDVVIEVIKKHTGITLELKDISMRNGMLRVKGTSLQKNEIFMKKIRIVKELESKLQSLRISDIQ